jgi:hypothetical protein
MLYPLALNSWWWNLHQETRGPCRGYIGQSSSEVSMVDGVGDTLKHVFRSARLHSEGGQWQELKAYEFAIFDLCGM